MSAIFPSSKHAPVHDTVSLTPARLFELLWTGLLNVLGSAATATLLRRSAKALEKRTPNAQAVRITRVGLEYAYELPPDWQHPSSEALAALRDLVGELRPILFELTGDVILQRLDRIDAFEEAGIRFLQGAR